MKWLKFKEANMNTKKTDTDMPENIESLKAMMNKFGIEINDVKYSSVNEFNLKTSHKKALLLTGTNEDILNFDFLKFKDGKIQTSYPVNEVIQKVIDYGNQQVDFFDALRLHDLETNKLYSYIDAVTAFIDFEFDWNNPEKHELVLNFSHNRSPMCQLVSNKSIIASGAYHSMHIVFDLEGNITVNRLNVHRKRTLEAWDNMIENSFREYGLLTEMARI